MGAGDQNSSTITTPASLGTRWAFPYGRPLPVQASHLPIVLNHDDLTVTWNNAACEPPALPRQVTLAPAPEGALFCPPDGAHGGRPGEKGGRTTGDAGGAP